MFFDKSRRFQWFHQELHQHHLKKVQEKGTAALFNATAPILVFWDLPIPWSVPFHMKKAFLSGPIRSAGAFVGVALPAKPFTFIGPRQPGPDFPGPSAPLLASPSLQSLLHPSGHANLARIFPARRRLCWRRPPRKAFYLRRATPTWPGRAFGAPGFPSVLEGENATNIYNITRYSTNGLLT